MGEFTRYMQIAIEITRKSLNPISASLNGSMTCVPSPVNLIPISWVLTKPVLFAGHTARHTHV